MGNRNPVGVINLATRRRLEEPDSTTPRRPPATTPEGRENQLISMAVDLAEQRMRDGTATAQEIVHFLRLGSPREQLERDRLERENKLLDAKVESLVAAKGMEDLIQEALTAMRSYSGQELLDDPNDYEE